MVTLGKKIKQQKQNQSKLPQGTDALKRLKSSEPPEPMGDEGESGYMRVLEKC